MDTIRELTVEIGPRPACSGAEADAARWCAEQLEERGLVVAVEGFRSRSNYAVWFAVYLGLSLLGAVVLVPSPLAGVLLGAAGLFLYYRDSDGRPVFKPRTRLSRNVVARPSAGGEPAVVVMAHMDSARSSPSFHPKVVGNFHASAVGLDLSLAAVPLFALALVPAEGDVPGIAWIPAALLGGYIAFAAGLLLYGHLRMPDVAGANDNASGVAVLMRLARMDWNAKVWFVVTGSEETGMVGSQAFLAVHELEVAGARLLNIDNVGAGRLLAVTTEGVMRERRADQRLVEAASAAGASPEPFKGLPTDATPWQARGLRAMTLLAVDDGGVPPNWHWRTDTIENIDPDALDRTTGVARSMLEAIVLEGAPR